jgi:hypothetical protein
MYPHLCFHIVNQLLHSKCSIITELFSYEKEHVGLGFEGSYRGYFSIEKHFWSVKVPQKVALFAWTALD